MEEKREDLLLRAACKELYGDVTASDTLKENVIAAQKPKATIFKTGRLSFAAMLAFVCVLVAGAGTVYALEGGALRERFFPNGNEHFEEVYAELNEDYPFGSHLLRLKGVVYDEEIGTSYFSFEARDKDGLAVTPIVGLGEYYLGSNPAFGRGFSYIRINAGGDFAYLVTTCTNRTECSYNGTEAHIFYNGEVRGKDNNRRMQFVILNQEEWDGLNKRVDQIGASENTGVIDFSYVSGEKIHPALNEILSDYNFRTPDYVKSYTQKISMPEFDIYVGRTALKLSYDTNKPIESLVMLREDGTRTEIISSDMQVIGKPGEVFARGFQNGFSAVIDRDGMAECIFNFGYILGAEEDVSIELNGKIYK